MNKLVEEKLDLLNDKGHLVKPGFSVREIFSYHRKMIKASKWRIKEWDYYCAISKNFAFSFTIADLGYMALINASLLDFSSGKETKKTKMKFFTFGKLSLPNSADHGNVIYKDKGRSFEFINEADSRVIKVSISDFCDGTSFLANLKFKKYNTDQRMLIATPFKENPTRFYYNQKINCMNVDGEVQIGDKIYKFDKLEDLGVLDWGRGVWTYKNTWYWGSLSCFVEGTRVGFNIGYGFGDTSKGTENVIFYDGKVHKLNNVVFEIDDKDYMKPWVFKSDDNRLNMTMTPILDRVDNTNLLIIKNIGHQVFGKFNGYLVLDNGKKIEIENKIGFAEKITNHY
ncbi:MAG: DUF2804 domain-containing protein [Candidatus Izemoplasmatales bacterium]|nr:DUF2804 domain-containing protein [Candidatus Izemoplasmatales bacterium]MDD4070214.1 DUF2804 domain-containing protein [Candidatus Izemoplasmatales bacterium]MDY0139029.1 DUF2804 domain-containing protein [Candidatus Izemoplasmatales bacterium]